ncbi:hypothetical protein thsps21_12790 [Pseudomonas sp. No.21]|uniref:hypothetical protein n=1 Tax=Pseudomonas tohonis TaxID=2725477 RepID=UPI001F20D120|nr:hypothetical protein [Pseudomonas tohonis]GJN44933.1 hypothetical protein TUM20249_09190 [Pseudomonas tohonis]
MTFQRENRYIVIKRKDLIAAAESGAVDASFAEVLDIVRDNLPTRECLVIESDWPEYEPAWQMIQARMEGATPPAAQVQGEREEFEAYILGRYPGATLDRHRPGHLHRAGRYIQATVEAAWSAWQARAALSAPPAADESEPAETLAARLIEVRAAVLGHAVPWAEAVEITATITKMPDEEKAALLAMDDAPPAAGVLEQMSEEARSTLVGMVEFCLERRYCMGMDEGFASFEPETEHGFVKELRAFVEGAPTPPASEQQQAVQQPHTVEFVGKTCQRVLMAEGKPYPRTCAVCGLSGPCKSFPRESDLRLNPHLAGVNQGVTTEAGNGGDA